MPQHVSNVPNTRIGHHREMLSNRERRARLNAVNDLVQSGLVEVAGIADGEPHYRLTRSICRSVFLTHAMQPVDERFNRETGDLRELE